MVISNQVNDYDDDYDDDGRDDDSDDDIDDDTDDLQRKWQVFVQFYEQPGHHYLRDGYADDAACP